MTERYKYDAMMIGKNIMELRKKKSLSREELGFMVNKSPTHLAKVEQGTRNMSIDLLFELLNALSVDANEILGIKAIKKETTIDEMLRDMDENKQRYFNTVFMQMLQVTSK